MPNSFDVEVLHRLPLADAAVRLLDFALVEDHLDRVFQSHRGRSYEDIIRFPVMTRLLADGLFSQQRSAHQSFQRAKDQGQLDVTMPAVYGKLRRLPVGLSLGLFDECAARLRDVALPVAVQPLRPSLQGFRCLAFDGKKLKHVLRRLKPLRGLKGKVFGGKLLVVQDMASTQAVALEAVLDGEAADNPLVPGAVARVRALPSDKPRLWVGDRAFCEYTTMPLLAERGDTFVIRYQGSCKFHPDPEYPERTGVDRQGRTYVQQRGWLGPKQNVRCRKITVTRSGDQPFSVVTNLEDADQYPADDLLELYRRRWGIETMFQQVVQTFDLRHLIGTTAQATIFQAVLCLLVYNITLTIREVIAQAQAKPAATISTKVLFDDLADELTGLWKLVPVEQVSDILHENNQMNAQQLQTYLSERLAMVWYKRWLKAPTRKQPNERKARAYLCGGHSSVQKIIEGKHHEIPLDNPDAETKPHETKKKMFKA